MLSRRVNPNVLWVVLIVSLCFNVGVGATFGVRGYKRLIGCPDRSDRPARFGFLDELGLSPEQQIEVDASKDAMRARHREMRRALHEENATLAELMSVPGPDHAAIAAQLDAIGALRASAQRHVVDHFLDIKERILRPDQRQAFDEHIGRVFSRGGPGMKGFRDHPDRGGRRGGRMRTRPHDGDE